MCIVAHSPIQSRNVSYTYTGEQGIKNILHTGGYGGDDSLLCILRFVIVFRSRLSGSTLHEFRTV